MAVDGNPHAGGGADPWPPLPAGIANDPQIEYKKILYQAQVDAAAAQQKAGADSAAALAATDAQRTQAAWSNEYALLQSLYGAYLDVTKGALDRAQSRAQFVQTAAAAVSTAYAGILALSYSVSSTNPKIRSLPVQGIVATLFLGLSIALATVYLAYFGGQGSVPGPGAAPSLGEQQRARLASFINWASAPIVTRVYFLHAAVVSLAVGVACLPVAYMSISSTDAVKLTVAGLAAVFVLPGLITGGSWRLPGRSHPSQGG